MRASISIVFTAAVTLGCQPQVRSKTSTEVLHARADALRAFTSLSVWLTQDGDDTVVHLAAEAFGNATTGEGRRALRTLADIAAGSPPATAYEALAADHPGTARFRQRAGDTRTGRALALAAGLLLPIERGSSEAARKRRSDRTVPYSTLRSNAIYTPNPDPRKIAAVATPANAGSIRIGFCVSKTPGGRLPHPPLLTPTRSRLLGLFGDGELQPAGVATRHSKAVRS